MRRELIAISLIGWYLMVPLFDEHNKRAMTEAPLGYWEQGASFDTAKECQQKWAANFQEILAIERKRYREHGADTDPRAGAGMAVAIAARCIASDDPRLGKR